MTSELIKQTDPRTKAGQTKKTIIAYCIEHGGATILQLAKYLSLSSPTVIKFVGELENAGCILRKGKLETQGGRYPFLYGLHPKAGYFIGVDVQHNKLNLGAITLSGEICAMDCDVPFSLEDKPETIEHLVGAINDFIKANKIPRDKILNVNINLPGRINPKSGRSYTMFVSLQEEKPLAEILRDALQMHVTIDNDTRGMAFGEYTQGAAQESEIKNMLYINLSWGLGLGMIIDGKVYTGKSGFCGELGHITFYNNQILCHCGKKGCMQTEVGGLALHRKVLERIKKGETSLLSEKVNRGEDISLEEIIQAIKEEDMLCYSVLEEVGRELGFHLAGLINIFNPEMIVLGGSMAAVGDALRLPVEMAIRRLTLNVVSSDTKIVLADIGKNSGVVGACMMARYKRFE
ncbi:ROK family transcriptional regulator [Porphyromonas miyakawae]|uniref:ROK family transcriptional regulator n=1 Tax=Porphyromonas miyakawae TaxID=3137470 RepID=A0ABQ0E3U3_9PORP